MSKPRSANAVSQRLRARGINVGYRHTDFGYVDRDGAKVTQPGVQVTRNKVARYGGFEDYGCVMVFVIADTPAEEQAYAETVEAHLVDAGLPYRRKGTDFEILDPDDPIVLAAQDKRPEPADPPAVRVLREHLATLPQGHHERPGLHRAIEILREQP